MRLCRFFALLVIAVLLTGCIGNARTPAILLLQKANLLPVEDAIAVARARYPNALVLHAVLLPRNAAESYYYDRAIYRYEIRLADNGIVRVLTIDARDGRVLLVQP